jgi:myo-inositol 2-dehydrogenase/D-chiro-inositol 1-dehydrogenase
VADAFEKAAKELATAYGIEVRSIDEIAASKDIDAVVICTPTDTHADLIEQFAKAGKAFSAKSRSTSTPTASSSA